MSGPAPAEQGKKKRAKAAEAKAAEQPQESKSDKDARRAKRRYKPSALALKLRKLPSIRINRAEEESAKAASTLVENEGSEHEEEEGGGLLDDGNRDESAAAEEPQHTKESEDKMEISDSDESDDRSGKSKKRPSVIEDNPYESYPKVQNLKVAGKNTVYTLETLELTRRHIYGHANYLKKNNEEVVEDDILRVFFNNTSYSLNYLRDKGRGIKANTFKEFFDAVKGSLAATSHARDDRPVSHILSGSEQLYDYVTPMYVKKIGQQTGQKLALEAEPRLQQRLFDFIIAHVNSAPAVANGMVNSLLELVCPVFEDVITEDLFKGYIEHLRDPLIIVDPSLGPTNYHKLTFNEVVEKTHAALPTVASNAYQVRESDSTYRRGFPRNDMTPRVSRINFRSLTDAAKEEDKSEKKPRNNNQPSQQRNQHSQQRNQRPQHASSYQKPAEPAKRKVDEVSEPAAQQDLKKQRTEPKVRSGNPPGPCKFCKAIHFNKECTDIEALIKFVKYHKIKIDDFMHPMKDAVKAKLYPKPLPTHTVNLTSISVALAELETLPQGSRKLVTLARCTSTGTNMRVWCDPGARAGLIHERAVLNHKLKKFACPPVRINGFGGSMISKFKARLTIVIEGKLIDFEPFVVVSSMLEQEDVLLGLDTIGSKIGLKVGTDIDPTITFEMIVDEDGEKLFQHIPNSKPSSYQELLDSEPGRPVLGTSKSSIENTNSTTPWPARRPSRETVQSRKRKSDQIEESLDSDSDSDHDDDLQEGDNSRGDRMEVVTEQSPKGKAYLKSPTPVREQGRMARAKRRKELHEDSIKTIAEEEGLGPNEVSKSYDFFLKRTTEFRKNIIQHAKDKALDELKNHNPTSARDWERLLPTLQGKHRRAMIRKYRRFRQGRIRETVDDAPRYDSHEIPESVDKVSAILRKAREIKEEKAKSKPPKAAPEQEVKVLPEDITLILADINAAAMIFDPEDRETAIAWELANVPFEEFSRIGADDPVIDHLEETSFDDEFDVAPVTILAEHNDSDTKSKVDWKNIPKRFDEEYVEHELDVTQRAEINQILSDGKDALVKDEDAIPLGQAKVPPFDIKLKAGAEERLSSKYSKAYPVKGDLRDKLKSTLDEMTEAGVGKKPPVTFAAEFAFPSFFAKRPRSNKLRLCVNFSPLNAETIPEVYPMPTIEDVHTRLSGKRYLSVMDLKSGYMQTRLTEQAKRYAVMITQEGLFQFDVLGFGFRNAVAYFQKTMNMIFKEGIDKGFLQVYVDDLILATRTYQEHVEALKYVLDQLKRYNLKAALNKCHFFLRQAKILGQIVGEDGISPDSELVKAVKEFPAPRSVQAVREFLGLTGHYRQYIDHYADISAPLTNLLKGNQKFVWDQKAAIAFSNLKKKLIEAPILIQPDFKKDFRLECDASLLGAGSVLSMFDPKFNSWRPIAYASWLFNSAQRNYHTSDRELLAIVLATRKFRPFLLGRTFKVLSDHQALAGNLDMSDPHSRIARWSAELSHYDFNIEYIKGSLNPAADALSRNFQSEERERIEVNIAAAETLSLPSDEEWVAEQARDPELAPIIRWIEKNELPTTETLARNIVRDAADYVIDEETKVLYKVHSEKGNKSKTVQVRRRAVPQSLRKIILSFYHDCSWVGAHMGRDKTYEKVAKNFHFPDMYRYIAIYVKTCAICQKVKDGKEQSTSPLGSIPTTERWDILSIDLWGPLPVTNEGNKYVLTVVDSFTKWSRAIPIPNKKMETIAKALWRNVFSLFGMPNRIHHDQGTEFVNGILKALTEMLGIDNSRTTAYHPQGNPFAERIHQFFGKAISAYVRDDQKNWDEYLDAIILAYNNAVHDTIGVSPAQLMLGRDLRAPGALKIPENIKEPDHLKFAKRLHEILSKAQLLVMSKVDQDRLKRALLRPDVALTAFKEGEEVMLYVPRVKPGKVHKLTPYWTGPFRVLRKGVNDKVYYLENEFGEQVTNPISLSRLKPFHNREELRKLNAKEVKPAFAIRDDLSDALVLDGAVAQTIRTAENLSNEATIPTRIVEEGIEDADENDLISPANIFGKPKKISESKKEESQVRPPDLVVSTTPLDNRHFKSDVYYVKDGKTYLKSRVAREGKRIHHLNKKYI